MDRPAPLLDVKVLDFSRAVSGPYVGRILSDLGADVVKVEGPGGDVSDQFGRIQAGRSGLYAQMNAGKRNIGLDLRLEEDVSLARELAESADVIIENFRSGTMDRAGLGHAALSVANPRLVMLSISGFGCSSPEASRRAYAPVIHAESGALVRHARVHGQQLVDLSNSVADTLSALHGAIAVLAALRQRDSTGQGAHLDLGMLHAVVASDDHAHEAIEETATVSENWGNIFEGVGGPVMLAMGLRGIWRNLSDFADLTDGLDPDAPATEKQVARSGAVQDWLCSFSERADMTDALETAGIGWADLRPPEQLLNEPTFQANPPFDEVGDGEAGRRRVVRMPYRFDGHGIPVGGGVSAIDSDRNAVVTSWLGKDH